MEQFKSYGISDQLISTTAIDFYIEELKINGYAVLNQVLNDKELGECRNKLDAIYEIQKKDFGEENLAKINELNLVRCPLIYDDYFLKIATNSKVLEIVENILGTYFILHLQNGVINRENLQHHQSSWHRDLPYQNFVSSKPLAIGALYCIDDFTEESGGTFVLPHSHKVENIPSSHYVEKFSKQIVAKAGSVILFDAMLFHKAGYNSANFTRRGINNVYVVPILKQQIDLFLALEGKYGEDEFLSKFLGYESRTPSSDLEWRQIKSDKR